MGRDSAGAVDIGALHDTGGVMDKPSITFPAQVAKVTTLADGGIRITLDLSETAIAQAAMLMECKREGIELKFTAKATI